MTMNPQLKNPKFYLMILTDVFLFVVSLCSAYLLRFEFTYSSIDLEQLTDLLLWMVPLKFIVFLAVGLYRGMWRYTSVRDFWLLARASLLSTALIMLIMLATHSFEGHSRGVFVADGIITFFLTGGARIVIRSYYAARGSMLASGYSLFNRPLTKVLIIGAGSAGEKILREIIMDNYTLHYEVAGFVDDDAEKQGRTIHGIRVLGKVDQLPDLIARENIQQIFIAVPSARGEQIRHIVDVCQKSGISYKILPGIGDLIDGRVSVKLLRDIHYEDLLGRSPVHLNIKGIRNYLDGKTILDYRLRRIHRFRALQAGHQISTPHPHFTRCERIQFV